MGARPDGLLRNRDPGVSEYPHPRTIVTPFIGMPGILRRSRDSFRVRHYDRDAAVFVAEATDPPDRTIRVGWVLFGDVAIVIDISKGDQ